jgi:hypothetical protein
MAEAWWGIAPEIGNRLESWGWSTEDEALKQYIPAIARHGNAVVSMPPSPAWATPALAAVLTAVSTSKGRALVLTAPALVEPLGRSLSRLASGTGLRILTATGPARASRQISDGTVDVLVASPGTALTLHTRSALGIDSLTSITLAWPEDWDAEEAVTLLLAELDKDAQRVVLTSSTHKVAELVQRHVRRSLNVDFPTPAPPETPLPAPRSVRTLATPHSARLEALTMLLEAVDPPALAIWTADRRDHGSLESFTQELTDTTVFSTEDPAAELVVCYDPPRPSDLRRMGASRDIVLLNTPGSEGYIGRLASGAKPIHRSGVVDRLRDRDAGLRAEISELIDSGNLDAAAYVVGPLFDRFDPQAVAAACLTLWRRAGAPSESVAQRGEPAEAKTPPATPVGGVANSKVWVGIGRRDEATPGDLVAVLIKEVGLSREAIGRIELRETFTLVEVPKEQAERVAQQLSGVTIRRRKLIARVDKGAPIRSSDDRGGPPRGGTGRPSRPAGNRPRS